MGIVVSLLLSPLAYIYGKVVRVRNWLFDRGVLKEKIYSTPILCVGNLFVGGTGKTPHVEMLLSHFTKDRRVAVISRGYKRKTKGLIVVGKEHTPFEVGDEPCQMKHKFPDVTFIVCKSRKEAVEFLEARPIDERPELIIMDDGFQHRYVKPRCSILLFPYMLHPQREPLLPLGKLREHFDERLRANIIIVTKCYDLNPINLKMAETELELYANQRCYFSSFFYNRPNPLINHPEHVINNRTAKNLFILPVACIANPDPFIAEMNKIGTVLPELVFRDHHRFTRSDIELIHSKYKDAVKAQPDGLVIIATTEKDAMRMKEVLDMIPQNMIPAICYFPIRTDIICDAKEDFLKTVEEILFDRAPKHLGINT